MIQLRCASPFQTGTSRTSLRVRDDHGTVHHHNRDLYEKPCLTTSGTTDHTDIFVPGILGVLWTALHGNGFCCRQRNVHPEILCHKWLDVFCCSPPGGTILHSFAELFGICLFLPDQYLHNCRNPGSHQNIHVVKTWQEPGQDPVSVFHGI